MKDRERRKAAAQRKIQFQLSDNSLLFYKSLPVLRKQDKALIVFCHCLVHISARYQAEFSRNQS